MGIVENCLIHISLLQICYDKMCQSVVLPDTITLTKVFMPARESES